MNSHNPGLKPNRINSIPLKKDSIEIFLLIPNCGNIVSSKGDKKLLLFINNLHGTCQEVTGKNLHRAYQKECGEMNKKEIISFDLDNTLIDPTYTTFVWERGIPQLYAKKHDISISKAARIVIAEYEKIGDVSLEWYDISYWFKYFELPGSWERLLDKHRSKIQLFPEVKEVIEDLAQYYNLIILSNAAREFVEFEIKEADIEYFFTRIFSATSDFGQVKKTPQFYMQICEIMEIAPSCMAHIGDHYTFDYAVPKSVGIQAYYLNRDGKQYKDDFTVKNLKEFACLVRNSPGFQ
jgi:HAD superfamily hydrolase (TIGR01549 family)